ncbi:MAG: hypothetical protein JKX69_07830 [Rhodobacteraceae bacterium]|nr:hypothetical protein [Paracoccaceae bacterium]
MWPTAKEIGIVEVPAMNFVMFNGAGAPGGDAYLAALGWIYAVSYGPKFHSKSATMLCRRLRGCGGPKI